MSLLVAGVGLVVGSTLIWFSQKLRDTGLATDHKPAQRSSWIPVDSLPAVSGQSLMQRPEYARLMQSILHKTGLSTENNAVDVEPILYGFAAFVQMLPASEAHHHAHPGGMLLHTLEVADFALSYRRTYMLPLGAGAEKVNELKHVWTYGVLLAALFHDLGKPMSDLQVTLYGLKLPRDGRTWHPIAGDMLSQGASHYVVSFRAERKYEDHKGLPLLLMQRLVPERVMAWLSGQDPQLVNQLLRTLSNDQAQPPGVLDELVKRADMESTRINLLSGPRTRFKSAREVPLVDILDEALCRLIQSGRLRFNVPGGHGFVWSGPQGQGDLLLVCPRIVDEMRKFLQEGLVQGSRGFPTDNLIIYSTWMDFARLRTITGHDTATPPRAVWRVDVEGIPTALTVLRFPRDSQSLKTLDALFPESFAGEITISTTVADPAKHVAEEVVNSLPPIEAADETNPKANPTTDDMPEFLRGSFGVDEEFPSLAPRVISVAKLHSQEANLVATAIAASTNSVGRADLVMPNESAETTVSPEPMPSTASESLASKLMLMKGPAPSTARTSISRVTPTMKIKETRKSEILEQFEDWLRLGLKSGHLQYNAAKAMIHFFRDTAQDNTSQETVALFVTPALYQRYIKELQPEKWANVSSLAEIPRPAWLPIQTMLLKGHSHRTEQQGKINRQIFRFSTKGGGMFNANVLLHPKDIFDIVPEPNPYIAGEIKQVALTQVLSSNQ